MNVRSGKTKSGFEFQIEDETLDDYELLEDLAKVDQGRTGKVVGVLEKLLGAEQKDKLKEHLRENGRVSAKRMFSELKEIFDILNEKN